MAIGVTCPIIVLNAKLVIAPHETPFKRIAVPKSSAGIDQDSGPLVTKNTVPQVSISCETHHCKRSPKLNSQVSTTKAQCAAELSESVGKTLIIAALMMNVTHKIRHP